MTRSQTLLSDPKATLTQRTVYLRTITGTMPDEHFATLKQYQTAHFNQFFS